MVLQPLIFLKLKQRQRKIRVIWTDLFPQPPLAPNTKITAQYGGCPPTWSPFTVCKLKDNSSNNLFHALWQSIVFTHLFTLLKTCRNFTALCSLYIYLFMTPTALCLHYFHCLSLYYLYYPCLYSIRSINDFSSFFISIIPVYLPISIIPDFLYLYRPFYILSLTPPFRSISTIPVSFYLFYPSFFLSL